MDIQMLQKTMLFHGMTAEEVSSAVHFLGARETAYHKGERIFSAGDTTEELGLVTQGSVTIESNDLWGSRTILSHVGCGQFFAETYAFLKDEVMLVDVCANEACRVLFFAAGNLRRADTQPDRWMMKLLRNLLSISARKNLILSGRSFHTAPKTVRARILSYFNAVCLQTHQTEFDVPFNRQQLADYLNLDRTALSKELGRMREEGMLSYQRNHFILHVTEP
ncbi:MAG TPA: Crp/Fnr family transcriptional regulator [Clostridiales bacterium]|nr:Crp/Fnr family transcriptional regulator [Clostridiales bacterium]